MPQEHDFQCSVFGLPKIPSRKGDDKKDTKVVMTTTTMMMMMVMMMHINPTRFTKHQPNDFKQMPVFPVCLTTWQVLFALRLDESDVVVR